MKRFQASLVILALGLIPCVAGEEYPLVQVGLTDGLSDAWGVTVSGKHAYVAGGLDGLFVVDISNPANPIVVGHAYDGGTAYGVAVSGKCAFLANDYDGLRIYDVSNPAAPKSIACTNDILARARSVAVVGNTAYLANGALFIYDISDPTFPKKLGFVIPGPTGNAYDVAVKGNYAYLSSFTDGLRICDVSNPTNPFVISHTDLSAGNGVSVNISGNHVYVGADWGGLEIFDISNPTNAVRAGGVSGFTWGVHVAEPIAFFEDAHGFGMFDVSDPSSPVAQARAAPGIVRDIDRSGNYIFVAGSSGLEVFAEKPPLAIQNSGTNTIKISWPAFQIWGFVLQEAAGLYATNWTTVTNEPIMMSNVLLQVSLPLLPGERYFRLKFQP